MNKEIKLQIPDSLYLSLDSKAKRQGVSLEALCLSLLDNPIGLVEPTLYSSLSNKELREEVQKLLQSDLPKEEVKKRVRNLENYILRFIK